MAFAHAHAVHSSYGRGTLQIIIENVKYRFAIFHDFYIAPWRVCTSDGFSKGNKAANLGITVLLIEMIGRHIPVREQEDLFEAHFLYGLFDLCQEKGVSFNSTQTHHTVWHTVPPRGFSLPL